MKRVERTRIWECDLQSRNYALRFPETWRELEKNLSLNRPTRGFSPRIHLLLHQAQSLEASCFGTTTTGLRTWQCSSECPASSFLSLFLSLCQILPKAKQPIHLFKKQPNSSWCTYVIQNLHGKWICTWIWMEKRGQEWNRLNEKKWLTRLWKCENQKRAWALACNSRRNYGMGVGIVKSDL